MGRWSRIDYVVCRDGPVGYATARLRRVVSVAVPIAHQPANRLEGFVGQGDGPGLVGRSREQRALDLDRIERKVVECRHPARVRSPGTHAEVAEEGERLRGSPGPANDDGLVPCRMAACRHDADTRQHFALAVGGALLTPVARETDLGLVVARDEARVLTERDLPFGALGD